jgi:hypothetical protein
MDLIAFGRILLVSRVCTVALSVWMGVCICGWPNSLSVFCIATAVLELMNSAPSLVSAAADHTAIIVYGMHLSTMLLLVRMFSFLP